MGICVYDRKIRVLVLVEDTQPPGCDGTPLNRVQQYRSEWACVYDRKIRVLVLVEDAQPPGCDGTRF